MRQLQISLCVLLYGDFPQLSHRCLSSIWDRLEFHDGRVRDIRLGLNAISPESRKVAQWFAAHAAKHYQIPVITYDSRQNACKYPLMRRMLLNDSQQPAAWVMWLGMSKMSATSFS